MGLEGLESLSGELRAQVKGFPWLDLMGLDGGCRQVCIPWLPPPVLFSAKDTSWASS